MCGRGTPGFSRYLRLFGLNRFDVVELSVEMIERRPKPTPNGGHKARCLLLVPRGHDAPPDLIDGLNRRKVALREVRDAPAVMVALAEQRKRRPKVVVIVHPQAQSSAEPLVSAIRKYHHEVAIWRYDLEGDPSLRAWPDEPQPQPSVKTEELRSTSAEPSQPGPEPSEFEPGIEQPAEAEPIDDIEPPLLSDEELAMLLGDDDADEPEKDVTR